MHASTKWLIGEIAVTGTAMGLLGAFGYPMVLPYSWHKLLHIVGAVVFLGNIIVTGAWMALAEQTHDRKTLRFAAEAVNWADMFFTAPGVFLLLTNGFVMAIALNGLPKFHWVLAALALFTLSGIVWVVCLIPDQHRLIALADEGDASFGHVLHRWYFWGIVATILPLLSLVLMVVKPALW